MPAVRSKRLAVCDDADLAPQPASAAWARDRGEWEWDGVWQDRSRSLAGRGWLNTYGSALPVDLPQPDFAGVSWCEGDLSTGTN